MSRDDQAGRQDPHEETIKTAGHIVKYSRELYNLKSVEEVANLTLEMTQHFLDGHPMPTVVEVREGELRAVASMLSDISPGEDPGLLVQQSYDIQRLTVCADESVEIAYQSDEMKVIDPSGYKAGKRGGVTVVAPRVYADEVGNSGALLMVHWPSLSRIEKYHVKPVDYLADHVATAVVNIRSRERLERARNDLAKRKEMVEVYDRLLRHDLGNDLQVISGFSDHVTSMLGEDHEAHEYVTKINSTSEAATELIENVGDTVKTLQAEGEPEAKTVEPILSKVVENVTAKFDTLETVYDPEDFDFQVYAGDLIDSVFTNILSNAAVHNEGEITVHLYSKEPAPDEVIIGMKDDGKGIARQVRDDIFEMGEKGPESEGTGFGLGLVRSLVESYGGSVEVSESEWGGADFRITLERV